MASTQRFDRAAPIHPVESFLWSTAVMGKPAHFVWGVEEGPEILYSLLTGPGWLHETRMFARDCGKRVQIEGKEVWSPLWALSTHDDMGRTLQYAILRPREPGVLEWTRSLTSLSQQLLLLGSYVEGGVQKILEIPGGWPAALAAGRWPAGSKALEWEVLDWFDHTLVNPTVSTRE